MILAVEKAGEPIPFVWFWPEGYSACAVLTHDVEAREGLEFVPELMDLDAQYGFRSSFQLVPEDRYEAPRSLLDLIKERGFEVNVHDLNHDGNLFRDQVTFESREVLIRSYQKQFGARGFRSGALYRNPHWIERLGFDYDMSIPNAALLDPQFGGCCTLMPFFMGTTLELPTTMVQDYSLFHILRQKSADLWLTQLEMTMSVNGLANFIIHPDYVIGRSERSVYQVLLSHLAKLRDEQNMWVALPGEVSEWWRARHEMRIGRTADGWVIEGDQCHRARLAFASIHNGNLVYNIPAQTQRAGAAD
ncbi:MAG TPA: hypothetical protein VF135_05815 [Terriglobales bacterium]